MDENGASTSRPKSGLLADWKTKKANLASSTTIADEINKNRPAPKPKSKSSRSGTPAAAAPPRRHNEPPSKPVALAKQIKDVLEFLNTGDGYAKTWEEIQDGLPVRYDLSEGGELRNALLVNPRVELTPSGDGVAYRSEHGIKNREDLLRWLRSHPDGTKVSDIRDAYRAIMEDIEALYKEKLIYKYFNYENNGDVLFAADNRINVRVSDDLKKLFLAQRPPSDASALQAQVVGMGMRSALSTVTRKRVIMPVPEKKARKKRATNVKNLTNAHLLQLFEGDGPKTIDTLPDR